jgi:hypothetical protein
MKNKFSFGDKKDIQFETINPLEFHLYSTEDMVLAKGVVHRRLRHSDAAHVHSASEMMEEFRHFENSISIQATNKANEKLSRALLAVSVFSAAGTIAQAVIAFRYK